VPIAHRTSVFELTPAEWADTQDLLLQARMALHDLLAPDGYLLGWNQGGVLHPHMHVIPRFDDEPLSDRWLRSAINVPENRRPDPWAPGSGRALRGPGERGALGLLAVRLVLLVPWAAQAVPRHRDPPSGGQLGQPQSLPLRHAPELLRELSCRASTRRPWGGRLAGRRRTCRAPFTTTTRVSASASAVIRSACRANRPTPMPIDRHYRS